MEQGDRNINYNDGTTVIPIISSRNAQQENSGCNLKLILNRVGEKASLMLQQTH